MNTAVYDDIDEFVENNDEDNVTPFVLAICIVCNDTLTYIGSGVIISANGLFLTAAHNFKHDGGSYIAHHNGKWYEIKVRYSKYIRGEKDLLIGELISFDSSTVDDKMEPNLGNCNNLSIEAGIDIAGYKSDRLFCPSDLVSTEQLIYKNHNITLFKQRIHRMIMKPSSGQDFLEKDFNNNILFYLESNRSKYFRGFSGGAAYKDKSIYGIIISNYFLKMNYIVKVMRENNIAFKNIIEPD